MDIQGLELYYNPNTAKLNNLNFHPLEVVSRYRDPQFQVGGNYSYLYNLNQNICQSTTFNVLFFSKLYRLKVI